MLWHRNRRATLRRANIAPPRSGRPKGDDGGARWSETALGLSPDAGTTWLLPRLVGLRQAQRLALSGERIDPAEAERIGLVTQAVDDDALASQARDTAERLVRSSMGALRQTRELLLDSFDRGLESQLEREAQGIARLAGNADGREGIAAFVAKRRPDFVGRNG